MNMQACHPDRVAELLPPGLAPFAQEMLAREQLVSPHAAGPRGANGSAGRK